MIKNEKIIKKIGKGLIDEKIDENSKNNPFINLKNNDKGSHINELKCTTFMMEIIKKEREKKSKINLEIQKTFTKYIPKNTNPNSEQFNIKNIIEKAKFKSVKLFQKASNNDYDIPFNDLYVNILVDCDFYISDENKFFIVNILCIFTFVLNMLKIPYSIALVADKDFTIIIKDFEEPHSFENLQKVLDCIFIKRPRT